jgi:hypothetical protein
MATSLRPLSRRDLLTSSLGLIAATALPLFRSRHSPGPRLMLTTRPKEKRT